MSTPALLDTIPRHKNARGKIAPAPPPRVSSLRKESGRENVPVSNPNIVTSPNVRGKIPPTPPPRRSSLKNEESVIENISVSNSNIPVSRGRLTAGSGSPANWSPSVADFRSSVFPSNVSNGTCEPLYASPNTEEPSRSSKVPARSPPLLETYEIKEPAGTNYAHVLPKSKRLQKPPNSRGNIPPSPPPRMSSLNRRHSTTSEGYPVGSPPPLPAHMEVSAEIHDVPPTAPPTAPPMASLRESRGRLLPPKVAKETPVVPRGSRANFTYSEIMGLDRWHNDGSSLGSGVTGASNRHSVGYESIEKYNTSIESPSIRTASPSAPAQRPLSELGSIALESEENLNPYAKPGPADPYVGSSIVVGLTKETFKKFIKDLDAAFVLFYDPCNKDCSWAKVNITEAALVTQRDNHVYAAVDCTKEPKLCRSEGVNSMPTMKLYTRGKSLATYGDDTILSSHQMSSFVENTPVPPQNIFTRLSCFRR